MPRSAPASGTRRAGPLTVLVLGSLTALGPLTIDLYLPALPQVGRGLAARPVTVQLTVTAFLIGLAAGQLVAGPLSDILGRRRPLLAGLAAYVLVSAACAVAPNAELLAGFRLAQGLVAAAGVVIARAVVRDLFDGIAAARAFSSLMLVAGAAPILAPVAGAQLLRFTSWRGVFGVLAVLGLVILALTGALLGETLPPARRRRGGLADTARTMRRLLADADFSSYLLAGSLGFAALFAYISGSSYALQEVYGVSPQTYSLLFAANSVGLIAVSQLTGKLLIGRYRSPRILALGLLLLLCAGLLLTLLVAVHAGLGWIAVALFLVASPLGLILPTAMALGLQRAPHAAGNASALLGTAQFLMGSLAPALAGLGDQSTARPMALTVVGLAFAAAVCYAALGRPWRRVPDPLTHPGAALGRRGG